jgi:hypothetical protein
MRPNKETLPMGDWLRELADVRCNAADLEPGMADSSRRLAVSRAMRVRAEIAAFEHRWPAPRTSDVMVPTFSWSQLERQLSDLVDSPVKAAMARDLVSATRKTSHFKPPEMVLREILCLAWALLDEDFQPEPEEGSPETP